MSALRRYGGLCGNCVGEEIEDEGEANGILYPPHQHASFSVKVVYAGNRKVGKSWHDGRNEANGGKRRQKKAKVGKSQGDMGKVRRHNAHAIVQGSLWM